MGGDLICIGICFGLDGGVTASVRCNASKAEAQSSLAVISPKHYFSQVSSATKTCFSLFSTQVLRSRRLPMPSAEKKFTYLRNCDIKLHGASQMTTLAECPVCYKRLHRRTAIQCLRCQECFHEACLEDHNKPYPDIEFSPAEERDGRFLYLPGFKPLVIRHEPPRTALCVALQILCKRTPRVEQFASQSAPSAGRPKRGMVLLLTSVRKVIRAREHTPLGSPWSWAPVWMMRPMGGLESIWLVWPRFWFGAPGATYDSIAGVGVLVDIT